MNRFDEKVYRVTKRRDGPSLQEQKGQLLRLKQDLEQFKSRQAGAAVVGSLQARIRDLESSITRAEAARMMDRESRRPRDGEEDTDPGAASGNSMRATSSRFPPRGRPGRTF
ncbi:Gas vesicle protein V [Roseomonas genomospecies 6]|uniref:Gas vesicle protein V n=1 Tax=Roseomonas genomospecies 6 TaxID=214106 RepID=A0A9W7NP95_9PROT|nr:Gas vesicle protein V [Roseomonas genomospecies 6]KAA0684303.1 Gas vesicle protein V [Roseomonas genomospecies 6]